MPKMTLAECPVRTTRDVIAGKWKPLILFFLKERPHRFGELLRLIEGASKKVLAEELRQLENEDILQRRTFKEVPPHVEYSLSDYGKTLKPILDLMCGWGIEHRARNHPTGSGGSPPPKRASRSRPTRGPVSGDRIKPQLAPKYHAAAPTSSIRSKQA